MSLDILRGLFSFDLFSGPLWLFEMPGSCLATRTPAKKYDIVINVSDGQFQAEAHANFDGGRRRGKEFAG